MNIAMINYNQRYHWALVEMHESFDQVISWIYIIGIDIYQVNISWVNMIIKIVCGKIKYLWSFFILKYIFKRYLIDHKYS